MKLRIAPEASADLDNIKQYISNELHNPDAAIKAVRKIRDTWKYLLDFPLMGAIVSPEATLRYLVCGHYLIFYNIDGDTLSIYRVLNSRQDYLQLLFNDLPADSEGNNI
jgi:addiction module RelE/StbE family toxin